MPPACFFHAFLKFFNDMYCEVEQNMIHYLRPVAT